ncbi:hypothetical protein [Duganella qianjiadongensis]|uniref:Uncharacterized protein n=1 Tax=Duganella qianjiadongensis TaxID=2692176 RepID=A0ABW9VHQ5_9BURK|nr:hypothetical protein [Duganella qianjiadongensis]MYM38727.1 hypothetical protein [Duganella qianjiadongensis]
MSIIEPITLTVAELAARWQQSEAAILASGLPMYFYFDGLVFEFGDKWHRHHGELQEARNLEAQQARQSTVDLDIQRQNLHRRGLLKLTQWEAPLDDDALAALYAEQEHLIQDIKRLQTLLKARNEERQRFVRNGLLRAAPRTLREIAAHGHSSFPNFAFMPASTSIGADEKISAGAVVALEDGFPAKTRLSAADLVLSMHDVRGKE